MTVDIFILLLTLSAGATSLVIEFIKKILDLFNETYDSVILSSILAFVVGVVEVVGYYATNSMPVSLLTFGFAIVMGVVNLIGAQIGYDTVKKFILAICEMHKK